MLHSFSPERFPAEQVRLMEPFGPGLYQWEFDYFRENFVKGICGVEFEPASGRELEVELSALAQHIYEASRSLVHRDLQSQNVMIRDGEPFLIDFQGMRFGSPFYDLGSLFCDPYVAFPESVTNSCPFITGCQKGTSLGPTSSRFSGKPRLSGSCKPWEPTDSWA